MTKLVQVCIGVVMLAMLYSCQVHAANTTAIAPTANQTSAGSTFNTTTAVSSLGNTTAKGAALCLQSSSFTLFIPVILAGSALHRLV